MTDLSHLTGQAQEPSAWPTPRAGDFVHGGANQHGSKGDLMLTSAAHHSLWATPVASAATNRATKHPPSAIKGTHGEQLSAQVHDSALESQAKAEATKGLILNPRWVLLLVGLPSDWLDVPIPDDWEGDPK